MISCSVVLGAWWSAIVGIIVLLDGVVQTCHWNSRLVVLILVRIDVWLNGFVKASHIGNTWIVGVLRYDWDMLVIQGALPVSKLTIISFILAFNGSNRKNCALWKLWLRIVPLLECCWLLSPLIHNIRIVADLFPVGRHHVIIWDNHIEYVVVRTVVWFVLRVILWRIGLLVWSAPHISSVERITIWPWTHNIHERASVILVFFRMMLYVW